MCVVAWCDRQVDSLFCDLFLSLSFILHVVVIHVLHLCLLCHIGRIQLFVFLSFFLHFKCFLFCLEGAKSAAVAQDWFVGEGKCSLAGCIRRV